MHHRSHESDEVCALPIAEGHLQGRPQRPKDASVVLDRVVSATRGDTLSMRANLEADEACKPLPPRRWLVILLVVLGNLMQYTSMFSTVAGGYEFSRQLGRGIGPGQANWMAAAYSGRLGAVFGHHRLLVMGGAIIAVFSLVNAFCPTYESFVAVRALTGIGGGIVMPNAVATLTIMVPRGRARNITLAIFASSPPVGAMIGALLSGALLQYTEWKWFFILLACMGTAIFGSLFVVLPKEEPVDPHSPIDYVGAALGLSSLAVFNFAWNQAPSVGWRTAYVPALVAASVLLFGAFLVWEKIYAVSPIMPLSVFAAPTFTALIVVVLFIYMSVGIALWYMVAWQQLLRGWTVLHLAVGWIPYSIGASAAVGVAAWMIPRLDAQWMLAIGVLAQLGSCLCLATMPERQIYWAQTFPAIVLGSVCPDFVYVAAQVITSNSVGKRDQGVAGSLVGTLNLYGNSLGLGFAGTVETQLVNLGRSEMDGYRAALYFGAALALVALLLDVLFVRMPKESSPDES